MTAPVTVHIGIRRMLDTDLPFVTNTWLENYQLNSDWTTRIDREVYFRSHRQIVHRLLAEHTALVAYDPDDPEVVLGFVCGDDYASAAVLHYVYVRNKLRGHGIAKALVEHLGWTSDRPIMASHMTTDGRALRRGKPILYNPYFAFADFAPALKAGKTTRDIYEKDPLVSIK